MKKARIKTILIMLAIGVCAPIAFAGWKVLYLSFFEFSPPRIKIIDMPRGVGIAPVTLKLQLVDLESGLRTVTITQQQRGGKVKVLLEPRQLEGKIKEVIVLDYDRKLTQLDEGSITLRVVAQDMSLWSNRAESIIELIVDYEKPSISVMQAPESILSGGTGAIFYRAQDTELADSGIRVGSLTFKGYPARSFDPDMRDDNLFVALFSTPPNSTENSLILNARIFAEDKVGNASSEQISIPIEQKPATQVSVEVSESFVSQRIAALAKDNLTKLLKGGFIGPEKQDWSTLPPEELWHKQFNLIYGTLRNLNSIEISSLLINTRFDRYWTSPLLRQFGEVGRQFGTQTTFKYQGIPLGSTIEQGLTITLPKGERQVASVARGVVAFSENLGFYGHCVAIDHGLGLASVYANLQGALVNRGESIEAGTIVGTAGEGSTADTAEFILELRISGVPVDPKEWLDKNWFGTNIISASNTVKRAIGAPVRSFLR